MDKGQRHIVITGVSRGLGRALARRFSALGHLVSGCARSAEGIARIAAELGAPHRFSVVDVVDDAAVGAWADAVIGEAGPPDLLINNAAIINPMKPLWEISAAEFDALIDINLKGVANVIRHFVPAMIQRKQGVIVNMSSGWGRETDAGVAPYCCSKWGIEGLTRSLAQELPNGMAAIPLNPGIIDTDMLRSCFGEEAKNYPDAERWAKTAAPFLLNLSAKDNGKPLTVS
ncbi:MAG: SDR family oxidoreductase [Rhodocyclaceae bacterium]|nr:SDR family oxidoreductase [Rhodocyclaceae bacterium]